MPIRLLLADDQTLFVDSLKNVLEAKDPEIEIVGIADSGQDAIRKANSLLPDIVLMDVRMGSPDGVEATRLIKQSHPEIQVVMLTTFDDDDYVKEALAHGAVGYLLKDIPLSELLASIRSVKEGAVLMSSSIAAKIVEMMGSIRVDSPGASRNVAHPPSLDELTKREREILAQIVDGKSNKEIASTLYLAEQTVKNIISGMYAKIGIHDRVNAVRMATGARQQIRRDTAGFDQQD